MSFEAQVLDMLTNMSGTIGQMKEKVENVHLSCTENKDKLEEITEEFQDIKNRLSLVSDETYLANNKWVEIKRTEEDAKSAAVSSWKNLVAKEGIIRSMGVMVPATFSTIAVIATVFWEKLKIVVSAIINGG